MLELARLPHLEVEGIFTHFAVADSSDKGYTWDQFHKFTGLIEELRQNGLEIPVQHVANSAALMEMPETHLDLRLTQRCTSCPEPLCQLPVGVKHERTSTRDRWQSDLFE